MAECSLMMLRTRRPKRSASSAVCDAARTAWSGCRARYQGGNNVDTYVDFADPGGMSTSSRCDLAALECFETIDQQQMMRCRCEPSRIENCSAPLHQIASNGPASQQFACCGCWIDLR